MKLKKILCFGILIIMLVTFLAYSSFKNSNSNQDNIITKDVLTGMTSAQIVADMGFGFNIGDTLDANSGKVSDVMMHEIAWGNPVINQELIDGIVNAGFTTIRIPTTWEDFISDDENYKISPAYLARVKEVVDYCYKHDVYVILNTHHEKWIENPDFVTNQDKIATKLGTIWSQIADYFAEYDQHLIFEGVNEPRFKGIDIEWTGNTEAYKAVNYFAQVFVNAVRENGKGYNNELCLIITGYAASNFPSLMRTVSFPTFNGQTVNNLIVSIHTYSPYNFCLSTNQQTFSLDNTSDTIAIDIVFEAIKSEFLDLGIPVIIGETGVTGKTNEQDRINRITYMGTKATEYGIPIILWDNGQIGTVRQNHCYFNRTTGKLINADFVNAMIKTKNSTKWGCALENPKKSAKESIINEKVILSFENGKTSTKEDEHTYISIIASENYFFGNRSIAVIYTGTGEPQMVLDSLELNQWWIPVAPDRIENVGDKKVAYFDSKNIVKVCESFGVTNYSQLHNMSFITESGNITTYEVSTVGEGINIVYKVNGSTYYVGTNMPENPVLDKMEFLGWYTTKDYRIGTEFKGVTSNYDITVYAKLRLKK